MSSDVLTVHLHDGASLQKLGVENFVNQSGDFLGDYCDLRDVFFGSKIAFFADDKLACVSESTPCDLDDDNIPESVHVWIKHPNEAFPIRVVVLRQDLEEIDWSSQGRFNLQTNYFDSGEKNRRRF